MQTMLVVIIFGAIFLAALVWSFYIEFAEDPQKRGDWDGLDIKETERLLKQELPPMHGVRRSIDGGWERF